MISLETLAFISVVLIGFYLIYLTLRQRMSHSARRFTLLLMPLLSVFAVVARLLFPVDSTVISIPVVEVEAVTVNAAHNHAATFNIDWQMIYLMGAVIVLLFLMYKVMRLLYFFRKATPLKSDPAMRILVTNDKDSFSFFQFIHLSADLGEEERNVVLEHEILHHKKSHSLDLILMELYHALFWFNPVMILIKRELIQTHEFEVDQEMYKRHSDAYLGHLLSYSLGASVAHLLLTSQFNPKMTLAKRIEKMKFNKKSKRSVVMIIPVLTIIMALTSWTYSNEFVPSVSDFSSHKVGEGDLDKNPQYVGGKSALVDFMVENVKYPKEAEKKGVEGTVHVAFTVTSTGAIKDVNVAKSDNEIFNPEAIRVVKLMPNWEPGEKNGKPVSAKMTLPITFKL